MDLQLITLNLTGVRRLHFFVEFKLLLRLLGQIQVYRWPPLNRSAPGIEAFELIQLHIDLLFKLFQITPSFFQFHSLLLVLIWKIWQQLLILRYRFVYVEVRWTLHLQHLLNILEGVLPNIRELPRAALPALPAILVLVCIHQLLHLLNFPGNFYLFYVQPIFLLQIQIPASRELADLSL